MLSLPNDVINIANTSSAFKAYSPSQATGNINPNAPPHHASSGGCGGIGEVLALVVGIAVGILTYGAASGLVAALDPLADVLGFTTTEAIGVGVAAGVAGDIASQGIELATGAESQFNWAGLALSAIGGAVSAGLSGPLSGLDSALNKVGGAIGGAFLSNFANGAISDVVTQGIGVATGLQKSFSWEEVGTSGLTAGALAAGQATYNALNATGNAVGEILSQASQREVALQTADPAQAGTDDNLDNLTPHAVQHDPALYGIDNSVDPIGGMIEYSESIAAMEPTTSGVVASGSAPVATLPDGTPAWTSFVTPNGNSVVMGAPFLNQYNEWSSLGTWNGSPVTYTQGLTETDTGIVPNIVMAGQPVDTLNPTVGELTVTASRPAGSSITSEQLEAAPEFY